MTTRLRLIATLAGTVFLLGLLPPPVDTKVDNECPGIPGLRGSASVNILLTGERSPEKDRGFFG